MTELDTNSIFPLQFVWIVTCAPGFLDVTRVLPTLLSRYWYPPYDSFATIKDFIFQLRWISCLHRYTVRGTISPLPYHHSHIPASCNGSSISSSFFRARLFSTPLITIKRPAWKHSVTGCSARRPTPYALLFPVPYNSGIKTAPITNNWTSRPGESYNRYSCV